MIYIAMIHVEITIDLFEILTRLIRGSHGISLSYLLPLLQIFVFICVLSLFTLVEPLFISQLQTSLAQHMFITYN